VWNAQSPDATFFAVDFAIPYCDFLDDIGTEVYRQLGVWLRRSKLQLSNLPGKLEVTEMH